MDHHSGAISQDLPWLLLMLLLPVTAIFPMVYCQQTEIDCLRSIKESLEDPLDKLSAWEFNVISGKHDVYLCHFPGIECWGGNKIMSITLSGMGLRGEFPRGIANCSSLTTLDLSNNHLYGPIPSDIGRLLNSNLLTGVIPAVLGGLKRLVSFTVANNLLSGPLPEFPYLFPPESYANNAGLCGEPLDPCTAHDSHKTLFMSGFVVGWPVLFALFLVIGLFTSFEKLVIKFIRRKGMKSPRLESNPSSKRTESTMISMLEKFATRMSVLELCKATDGFSQNNVIAIDEVGTTYKAMLSNGWCLAIKRLISAPHIGQEFQTEILTLGRLRHKNLVPLVGFCYELNERFLVYKFMPNGSLHDCFFSAPGEAKIMEWPVRVRIAVGIAKGLAWLHQNRVVHRGISSKCILLDENFNPRISDFGKAMILEDTCLSREPLSRELPGLGSYKRDVHCFGMVLFELIMAIKYSEIFSSSDVNVHMSEHISHLLSEPQLLGISVQCMVEQGFYDQISHYLRIAGKCLDYDQGNRPDMQEVYQMLSGISRCGSMDASDTSME
ncbi:probably inactive leucine-rich repeat receptor-like protein kinase At5g48380 isoform X3 [Sesamum indicum]|uniref:Probably inactive leucine-rich repeat receptor-like protein kinase At5g48380 isoform X3 n=1 Tax=Sesamum indicum TaxID=4182 RepID=A0A6I9U837_SESIN|nr:probably inactive leucine-rich repeat receptor-like protein kinase At5g48380 isoform X3 [Sesamum indicum]